MPYANNKGADQPAHPRSLISAFVVCCLNSIMSILAIDKISRLWLVFVAEQAGLSLTWSQTPRTGFLMTRLIKHFFNAWIGRGETLACHRCGLRSVCGVGMWQGSGCPSKVSFGYSGLSHHVRVLSANIHTFKNIWAASWQNPKKVMCA